ncbi:MAG: NERD domain-containing protein [bacterium]|nr:NERD domain-containing protein [bacterium]
MGTVAIQLRYESTCRVCDKQVQPGSTAHWDPDSKAVTCKPCSRLSADPFASAAQLDKGVAASNLDRLVESRANGSRTEAFRRGAEGEHYVGEILDGIPRSRVLHSRRFGAGDIDHVVIAPSGVWVVDAKNYSGAVTMPVFGSLSDLRVGGRRIHRELDKLDCQLTAVSAAVAADGVPVRGALCFVGSGWPVRHLFVRKNRLVAPPKRLARHISGSREVAPSIDDRAHLTEVIAEAFPAL